MSRKQKFGPFRPVLNTQEDREKSILDDTPAVFEIKSNIYPLDVRPKSNMELLAGNTIGRVKIKETLDTAWDEIRTFDHLGKKAVRKHDKTIMKHAQKHNLDPDLTRAVMYAENARGHKIVLNKLADDLKKSDSPLPMNIQRERWSKLIGKKPDDLYDADANIEAATVLLKRISSRVKKPTPEKVGSIWQYTGREKTNEFGEYIGKVYKEKPWLKID
ncbi:MAG: hypothetical protein OEY94_06315 [Alphaproteobacteria bacterium]|nr:hypothetical protein [Alphaproteobacteria bacterium]